MKNTRTVTEITMSRLARVARAASAALLVVSCSPDEVLSPAPSRDLSPAVKEAAIRVHVDASTGVATVTESGIGAFGGSRASFATAQAPGAVMGAGAIALETGAVTRTTIKGRRTLVTFDVAIINKLSSVELLTPTIPAPPPGVTGILLFPVRLTVTYGPTDKKVEESDDWDGSATDFLGGMTCIAKAPSCAPYEAFPAPILPSDRSAARTVGFIVDKDVQAFDVFMIVTADQHDRPMGGVGGLAFSTVNGRIAGATMTLSPGAMSATTDSIGEFSLARVDTGTYSLAASSLPENCPAAAPKNVHVTTGGSAQATFEVACNPLVTVTGITPDNGASNMSHNVTITGTNFLNVTGVTIDGQPLFQPNVVVVSSTEIQARVFSSSGRVGPKDVVVLSSTNGRGTCVGCYTFNPKLTITSIEPTSGPLAGGGPFTLRGTNFHNITDVIFGFDATFTVVSDSVITGIVPPGYEAGLSGIMVISTSHSFNDCTCTYTYLPAMSVESVTPASGPLAGGTTITVAGTNFSNVTSVTVGGVTLAIQSHDDGTITGVTPASATSGAKDIVVTSSTHGTVTRAGGYTYNPALAVASISPNNGPVTQSVSVTISGANFVGVTQATVGGLALESMVVTATAISGNVPANVLTGAADVVVVSPSHGAATCTGCYAFNPRMTITSITPASGPVGAGTSVEILGDHLETATVLFGGLPPVGKWVHIDGGISATVPASAQAGPIDVVVTSPVNGTLTCAGCFTYLAPMTVTSVTPNNGLVAGNTNITIAGSNFTDIESVSVGGALLTNVSVNPTQISGRTPSAPVAGVVDIVVTSSTRGSATCADCYTYRLPGVHIASISPDNGPANYPRTLTITGEFFTNITSVKVGGKELLNRQVVSSTKITGFTGTTSVGTEDVVVTSSTLGSDTCSGCYTRNPLATITSVTPNEGSTGGGTLITITGTNFNDVDLASAFLLDTAWHQLLDVTVVNSTTITAHTPAAPLGAMYVQIDSRDNGRAQCAWCFTYKAPASITSVVPNQGPLAGGTPVTITGTNLAGAQSATLGGLALTITSVTNTQITATTPVGAVAGLQDVAVSTATLGNPVCANCFRYNAPVVITGVTPASGPQSGGTTVTLTGVNLTGAPTVKIGGVSASVVSANGSTMTVHTGVSTSTGTMDVVVSSPQYGSATCADCFTYTAATFITSVSPGTAPWGQNVQITIIGTNFSEGSSVKVGSVTLTSTRVSDTEIIATMTPQVGPGTKDIVVTSPGFGSATCVGCFEYPAPVSISLSPNAGPAAGGTVVTISGTNLVNITQVMFGTVSRPFSVGPSGQITFTTVAHAAGNVFVSVLSSTNGSAVASFTAQ